MLGPLVVAVIGTDINLLEGHLVGHSSFSLGFVARLVGALRPRTDRGVKTAVRAATQLPFIRFYLERILGIWDDSGRLLSSAELAPVLLDSFDQANMKLPAATSQAAPPSIDARLRSAGINPDSLRATRANVLAEFDGVKAVSQSMLKGE